MSKFVICEISGKQYKAFPNTPFIVGNVGDEKKIEAAALFSSDEGKIEIGKPFLKNKIILEVLESIKGDKIRVAKYSAKANYRKVTGSRQQLSKVVWKD